MYRRRAVELEAKVEEFAAWGQRTSEDVVERDRIIRDLQAELHEKVGERDRMAQELQAELHAKIGERDGMIQELQAELNATIEGRDRAIQELQAEAAARAVLENQLVEELEAREAATAAALGDAVDGDREVVIQALQEELEVIHRSRAWRVANLYWNARDGLRRRLGG
jgi:hypothetical protein